ncbi:MAG: putative ABC transporter permease, partial [Ruminococcus sp.]|nr:putative ABC transporter permease [Ruminococcus sp.]
MYWIHLLWYFIIISFLGWLFSSLYHFFSEKKFYDNGFLTLPFCPAYGAGAVICYVVFKPLTDNFLIIFIGSALLLSFFTVIAGFIGKKILGCKPWDYSNLKFNIGSYLTFPFVVIMGLGGVFCVKILIPMLRLGIVKIPD